MSRLLLAGVGPLPPENPERLFGPGLRAWIFAETLARAGHEVHTAIASFGATADRPRLRHGIVRREGAGGVALTPQEEQAGAPWPTLLGRIAETAPLDGVVALTDLMAEAAARANIGAPLWFDFLGSPMAERQQQAVAHDHDGGLADAWRQIVPCLLSGDRFSTCSSPQRFALIGELGACGRLNRLTSNVPLVHVIPPGAAFGEFRHAGPPLRGRIVPEDAFVVLWAGGFNTWTDVDTLHAGLASAMDRDPSVHFVSFGGAIPGHCETVYPRFERLAAAGPCRDRFHLMGWAEPPIVQSAFLEADVGINIDCPSVEGLLGTRSRLLEWMAAGLPILTTPLCELSEQLIGGSMAYSFRIGDASALADAILEAAGDGAGRKEKARRAAEWLEREFSHEALLAPLLAWAARPERAPDLGGASPDEPFPLPDNPLARAQLNALREAGRLDDVERFGARMERRRAALARLQGSRCVRLFMRWKGWKPEET